MVVNNVEDALVHGGVDLVDDRLVDLPPLSVALGDGRHRAHEVVEAELAEDRLEQGAPLPVVDGRQVEEDRDVLANVDLLHDVGRSRLRSSYEGVIVGGRTGGVNVGHHGRRERDVATGERAEEMRKRETRILG